MSKNLTYARALSQTHLASVINELSVVTSSYFYAFFINFVNEPVKISPCIFVLN